MEKKPPHSFSTGENFAASCILLSRGNGTVSSQEVQTGESQTINSIRADTPITVVISTNFKFRKARTQLGFM